MSGSKHSTIRLSRARAFALLAGALLSLVPALPAGSWEPGFMTGGGSVFTRTGVQVRITHGFELHCQDDDRVVIEPNNLQINWPGWRFHLEELTEAVCTDQPGYDEGLPEAGFDTMQATGTGRCNGVSGATITWRFTDAGEPGTRDFARISIQCPQGTTLFVEGLLRFGNHQAHPERKA